MQRLLKSALIAATSLALASAPALPYDVKANGQNIVDTAFSGAAQGVTIALPLFTSTCSDAAWDGDVPAGGSSTASHIASVTSSMWNNCTGPLNIPSIITQNGVWEFHGTSPATDSRTDVIDGYLDNVSLTVSRNDSPSACTFVLEGRANGQFDENTQELIFNYAQANSKLKVTQVDGCYGLARVGDPVGFDSTFKMGEAGDPAIDLPINIEELSYDVWVAGQNTTDTAFSGTTGFLLLSGPLMDWGCSSTSWAGTVLAGDTGGAPASPISPTPPGTPAAAHSAYRSPPQPTTGRGN